jgi:TolB-like protein
MSGQGAIESLLFEGFTLDRRGLFRLSPMGAEVPVSLGARALDLLLLLAARGGAVVSKHDLIAEVWSGIAVEESNLTKQISALRRVLDQSPGTSCIQTVPGRGYRFVATVSRAEHATAIAPPPAVPERPAIAVLPFQNLMGDPEQEYFVDGVVEEITTAIAHYSWLLVIARGASLRYKGKLVDLRHTARELGARYLLEGSVRKSGNRVRITGELVDATTGLQIWNHRFDGRLDDIFDIQDQVAAGVAGAIEPKLRVAEIERASRKPTDNPDAYDLYLRAWAQGMKKTRDGMAESVRLARRALEIDPSYAPAMGRLAVSQMMRRNRHWIPDEGPDVDEGIRMARLAIHTAPDDAVVLDLGGLALSNLAGDNDAALSAIERALVLSPNFAMAHGHHGLVLAFLNRPEEAIVSVHRAIRLSPVHPTMFAFCNALGLAHLTAGRYEEALGWIEEALRENSGLPALERKVSLCGHLCRHGEAANSLRRLRELHSDPTIAGIGRDLPRGMVPEVVARFNDGLRKGGVPER